MLPRPSTIPERSIAVQLTNEQIEAVRSGRSVRLSEGGTDLVVLRADVYERLRELLYDDNPWSDEEMDLLAAEDADALGWEGMEAYQGDDR
jgi:hypothetical protein